MRIRCNARSVRFKIVKNIPSSLKDHTGIYLTLTSMDSVACWFLNLFYYKFINKKAKAYLGFITRSMSFVERQYILMENTYEMILEILEDELGYVFMNDFKSDFAITDYITDSIQFVHFIVALEEKIGLELSDDFLDYDIYTSIFGFIEKLEEFIQKG